MTKQIFHRKLAVENPIFEPSKYWRCLLYTSDAADERSSVDLGGRRIIKKKNTPRISHDTRDRIHMRAKPY